MNTKQLITLLAAALDSDADSAADLAVQIRHVLTFDEAGLLTRNEGLVIQMTDGAEFQITIVKSR